MSLNLMTLTGRIGRDAEFRAFPNGGGVLSFSVATNSGYGDKEKTLWLRANLFGKRAEGKLGEYLVKGQEVALTGELSENEYTTKEGEARKSLEINVQNLELIGGRSSNEAQKAKPASASAGPNYGEQSSSDYPEDDLPY